MTETQEGSSEDRKVSGKGESSFSLKLDSRGRWLLVYADFLGAAETEHGKI